MTSDPRADLLPLTVLIPETAADPVVVFDQSAALRFAIVERASVPMLAAEWDEPGNYLLLDAQGADGRWGVYVGKAAPGGVRTRLLAHLRSKEHWSRAVIIQRDTTYGFNSAQVGWLEGRLHDLMVAAVDADLHNGNRPSDETLPPFDRAMLEACVLPVRRLLRLIGHDPAAEDDSSTAVDPRRSRQPRNKKFHGVKLSSMIGAGVLVPGTRLVSTNGAWPATAVITDAGLDWEGRQFDSPSGAAMAIKGGPANGWEFWAIETESGRLPLSTLRARYQETLQGDD
ncbi:hypothetical protein BH09ACT11_BH09ACT11_12550 [soil metagenome]